MAQLIGNLVTSKDLKDPSDLMSSLESVRDMAGTLGSYSFQNQKAAGKFFEYPIRIKQIVDGRGVPLR